MAEVDRFVLVKGFVVVDGGTHLLEEEEVSYLLEKTGLSLCDGEGIVNCGVFGVWAEIEKLEGSAFDCGWYRCLG